MAWRRPSTTGASWVRGSAAPRSCPTVWRARVWPRSTSASAAVAAGPWPITHAIRACQEAAPIDAKSGTFASIVKRCEVAFLYDRGCVPSYTVAMIEFDEPPWDRFLDKPWGRFICPGCGQTLDMHVSHGPGTPGTERFREVAQAAHGSSATSRGDGRP